MVETENELEVMDELAELWRMEPVSSCLNASSGMP